MPGENLSEGFLDEVITKYDGLKAKNNDLVKEIELLSTENKELEDKKNKLNEENKRLLTVLSLIC